MLKDASSTAIYGSRGANGVILITTKRGLGTTGKPNITFKTDIGFSQLPPPPRHRHERGGIRTIPQRLRLVRPDANHPDIGADTPLSGSVTLTRSRWAREPTGSRRSPARPSIRITRSRQTKNLTTLSQNLIYNDTQGIIDDSGQKRFTGQYQPRTPAVQMAESRLRGLIHGGTTTRTRATTGGTNWWERRPIPVTAAQTDGHIQPAVLQRTENQYAACVDRPEHPLPRTSFEQPQLLAQTGTDQELHDQQHLLLLPLPASHVPLLSGHAAHEERKRSWAARHTAPTWDENSFSWGDDAGYKFEKNGHRWTSSASRLPVRVARLQSRAKATWTTPSYGTT